MPIKLVFEGMDAEEILEEIKTLFGNHFVGQVTEVTKKETVIELDKEVSTPQEPEKERLSMFLNKSTAVKSEKNYTCKDCGTTESGYWRAKTLPHGPLCNACGQKHTRTPKSGKTGGQKRSSGKTTKKKNGGPCRTCGTAKSSRWLTKTHQDGPQCQACYYREWKEAQNVKASTGETTGLKPRTCRDCDSTETSLWRGVTSDAGPQCNACYMQDRKKSQENSPVVKESPKTPSHTRRNLTLHKPIKGSRLTELQEQRTKAEAKSEPVKEETTDDSQAFFGTWMVDTLRRTIFDPQGFIIGGTLLQGWYKAQHGNDTSGMDAWLAENSASSYVKIQAAFALFQKKLPTAISLQESDGNPMLMVLNPSMVTSGTIPSESELREVFTNE